jgi:hypothetical protein
VSGEHSQKSHANQRHLPESQAKSLRAPDSTSGVRRSRFVISAHCWPMPLSGPITATLPWSAGGAPRTRRAANYPKA